MEGQVLRVDHGEPGLGPGAQALDKEQVALLGRRLRGRGARAAGPDHPRQVLLRQRPHRGHVVHGIPAAQVALEPERPAEHGADEHPAAAAARQALRLRDVAVGLLRHVCKVDAQAVHVTLVPLMLLGAVGAVIRAERRGQPAAARHWAGLGGSAVRGRLEPVSVEDVQDAVVRAMVQLSDHGLLAVLCRQVLAILLVKPREYRVLDGLDGHDAGLAIVEGCGGHETAEDLVALGTAEVHALQLEARPLGLPARVPAPARVRVPQVLAPAVLRDPLGAPLPGRAVRVVHADRSFLAGLEEGQPVQPVHQLLGHGRSQHRMRLLEGPAHDLHPQALHVPRRVAAQEGPHVGLQLLVRVVRPQEPQPEHLGLRPAHEAGSVRGQLQLRLSRLRAPAVLRQDQLELRTGQASGGRRRRGESHNVPWQDLRRRRDDIILALWHPNVVPILVRLTGRLGAQAERAHQHERAAPAVPHRDVGALGKVLARTIHLATAQVRAEADLDDRQEVLRVRAVETLQRIGFPAKAKLQLQLVLAELPG
mmetsp:Transcript_89938/g.254751  ORF Transcript_89938/g.254751 Transcript_89938/m.254751 type:complete len:536 (-) Transcript_89938:927-2534(-)